MAIHTRYTPRRICQYIAQLLILTIGKIIFLPVTKRNVRLIKSALKHKNNSYIIVANHRRSLDPFVTICGLPYAQAIKLLPINFMTANFFYDSFIRPLCWLAGCYPARDPKGKHKIFGVDGSVELIKNGFSVFMFPEGKRMRDGSRGPAHSGVVRIHQAVPETQLLLCHMKYNNSLKAMLSGKRFELVYNFAQKSKYTDPETIMDELFAL
jgi:1-acyl-sn-glycerol-3-phosphate acyltransferase